ncbi:MAG: 2-oxoglutarate ferredoxin oxidoreductase subunit beta [Bryobacteraceae bacterium]|nr:MAG: 2-oxoglutarate ferredoxin oxidoreductase subunit beta [Bryobacteraceae bacterium]
MSSTPATPPKVNRIGLDLLPYRGGKTTLCAGCGHNAITERLIEAYWELGIEPWNVAKLSGIGCSSKTPAYFLNQAHGFNGVHGRAPTTATGTLLANHRLRAVVVSGDGDTASIGIGHFVHMLRRNVPLVYIVENNGVYGLTKGQFSATADLGAKLKSGAVNPLHAIDVCLLGIELGATFVARSFSGDKRQLSAILKAAISHNGLAVIDVISPCVTFNDHEGSTKSYAYMKDHDEPLHEVDFIPYFSDIDVEYEEGESRLVELHDGSKILLHKLEQDYDPSNRIHALEVLHEAARRGEVLTGIIYLDTSRPTFTEVLNLCDEPLALLPEERVRPSREVLEQINEEFR